MSIKNTVPSKKHLVDELLDDRLTEVEREKNAEGLRTAANSVTSRRIVVRNYLLLQERWELTDKEAADLLGVRPTLLEDWRQTERPDLATDVLERISYLIGIYNLLCYLYDGQAQLVGRWMTTERKNMLCGGKSPISVLSAEGIEKFASIRRHLAQLCRENGRR